MIILISTTVCSEKQRRIMRNKKCVIGIRLGRIMGAAGKIVLKGIVGDQIKFTIANQRPRNSAECCHLSPCSGPEVLIS